MELLSAAGRDLTITEIGTSLHMGKGTVHRFLSTLRSRKFVQQDAETKRYGFGIRAYEMGLAIRKGSILRHLLMPTLKDLAAKCREAVNAAILEHDEIIYIIHLEAEHGLRFFIQEGSRLPAASTALGKVMLAALPRPALEHMFAAKGSIRGLTKNSISSFPRLRRAITEVRRKGLAFDREESFPGVCCVAAPVRNSQNEVVAAISISGPRIRMTRAKMIEYSEFLTKAAVRISQEF